MTESQRGHNSHLLEDKKEVNKSGYSTFEVDDLEIKNEKKLSDSNSKDSVEDKDNNVITSQPMPSPEHSEIQANLDSGFNATDPILQIEMSRQVNWMQEDRVCVTIQHADRKEDTNHLKEKKRKQCCCGCPNFFKFCAEESYCGGICDIIGETCSVYQDDESNHCSSCFICECCETINNALSTCFFTITKCNCSCDECDNCDGCANCGGCEDCDGCGDIDCGDLGTGDFGDFDFGGGDD